MLWFRNLFTKVWTLDEEPLPEFLLMALAALVLQHNFVWGILVFSIIFILRYFYFCCLGIFYYYQDKNLFDEQYGKKYFNDLILKLLIILELVFFSLGLLLPLIQVTQFWVFKETTQIIYILEYLFNNNEMLLGYLILYFGVFGTFIKILFKYDNIFYLESILHRFSFFDVFVIALLIFSSKLSAFMQVDAMIGTYFLITSLALSYAGLAYKKIFYNSKSNSLGESVD